MDIYKFTGPKFLDSSDPNHSFALETFVKQKFWFSPASNQKNSDDLRFKPSPKLPRNCYDEYMAYGYKQMQRQLKNIQFLSFDEFSKSFNLQDVIQSSQQKIRDAHILCSFTETNSNYMWDEYAEKGTGFCAVYSLEDLQKHFESQNIVFKKVEYGEAPELESYETNYLINKFAIRVCTTKPMKYSIEKEWRAITPATSDCSPTGQERDAILPKKVLYAADGISNILHLPLKQYCSDNNIPIEEI